MDVSRCGRTASYPAHTPDGRILLRKLNKHDAADVKSYRRRRSAIDAVDILTHNAEAVFHGWIPVRMHALVSAVTLSGSHSHRSRIAWKLSFVRPGAFFGGGDINASPTVLSSIVACRAPGVWRLVACGWRRRREVATQYHSFFLFQGCGNISAYFVFQSRRD